jgi:hypothetical protein
MAEDSNTPKKGKKARKGASSAVVDAPTDVEAAVEVTEVEATEVAEVVVDAPVKVKGKRGRKGVIPFAPGSRLTTCNYEGRRGFAEVEAHPTDADRQILVYNGVSYESLTLASNAFAHDVQVDLGHADSYPGTSGARIWHLAEDYPDVDWRSDANVAMDPSGRKPKRGRKPKAEAAAPVEVETEAEESAE